METSEANVVNCTILFIAVEVELDSSMVSEFLKEVVIMRKFNHSNVLKLLGVTVHDSKPCIIMPLMLTDLKHYLKQNRKVNIHRVNCLRCQNKLLPLTNGFVVDSL